MVKNFEGEDVIYSRSGLARSSSAPRIRKGEPTTPEAPRDASKVRQQAFGLFHEIRVSLLGLLEANDPDTAIFLEDCLFLLLGVTKAGICSSCPAVEQHRESSPLGRAALATGGEEES